MKSSVIGRGTVVEIGIDHEVLGERMTLPMEARHNLDSQTTARAICNFFILLQS